MAISHTNILAIANQKGGVGKTTTALSLGAAFVLLGKKTLVVDLDPHASATIHLAYYPETITISVLDMFLREEIDLDFLYSLIKKDKRHFFDFIPGSIKLSMVESELRERPGKGLILKKIARKLTGQYEYIILDCPPNFGIILVNALVASTLTVIPIQAEFLALHGLKLTFDTIRMLNKVLSKSIYYKALATMFDQRVGACKRVVDVLKENLKDRFFETIISIDTKFREASARGEIIYNLYPNSRGAKQYMQLAKEIESIRV
ncbi:ParA family protein [Desulfothermus okinawensis JCM 13304]